MLGSIIVNALLAGSSAASPVRQWQAPPPMARVKGVEPVADKSRNPAGTLPFAHGKKFATLNAYLAHRETLGAMDAPWYRQIRPGVYELVTRPSPGIEPQTFTRAELAEKFGFKE